MILTRRASVAAIAGAAVLAILYAASLTIVVRSIEPVERRFDSAGSGRPVSLYVDLLGVDPIRREVQARVVVSTQGGSHGERFAPVIDRNLTVAISDGDAEMQIRLVANREAPVTVAATTIRGSVWQYPLDSYTARISFSAYETGSRGERRPIPIQATMWEGLEGWEMSAIPQPAAQDTDLAVEVRLARTWAVTTFAFTVYGIMIIVAASGIVFVTFVARGVRRIEATLTGALCAMLFALPALRNVLPGSPPFGIIADGAIFLWSEVAVALSLVVFVISWVRRGPAP
jgi:hypothetical protein